MRQSRSNELKLNFDGLTDSITNLVGVLILLVVMLIGITQSATAPGTPGPDPVVITSGGGRSVSQLVQKTQQLQAQILAIENEIDRVENVQLPELRQRVQELTGMEESDAPVE